MMLIGKLIQVKPWVMGFFKRVEIIAISTPKKLERNKYSNKKEK